jgi:meso-butanediol dehydrogenase/(S,S)-butanediol dehydrogenase/diacetyl reductase
MKLEGQVALVTGAARGIGKTIALALARDGADVAIADLDEVGAEATAGEIEQLGRHAFAMACDVGSHEQVQAVVTATIAKLGRSTSS